MMLLYYQVECGAVNLRDDEKVNELVKKFYDEVRLAAICAGQ